MVLLLTFLVIRNGTQVLISFSEQATFGWPSLQTNFTKLMNKVLSNYLILRFNISIVGDINLP